MVRILFIAVVVLTLAALAAGQTFYGTTDLAAFRDGRDKEFRNRAESPLKAEDFTAFKGLNYFPTDDTFRVTAELTRTPDEKVFQMPTSAGTARTFVKYGVLKFTLAEKTHTLSIYQADADSRARHPEYADLLFIPFRDQTNGSETYGAGRYIDIKMPKDARVTIDFNLAYNPNCAYGRNDFSCPVPPKENFLQTRVTAGEMNYKSTGKTTAGSGPTIQK
jgi:uncharacterized protein